MSISSFKSQFNCPGGYDPCVSKETFIIHKHRIFSLNLYFINSTYKHLINQLFFTNNNNKIYKNNIWMHVWIFKKNGYINHRIIIHVFDFFTFFSALKLKRRKKSSLLWSTMSQNRNLVVTSQSRTDSLSHSEDSDEN